MNKIISVILLCVAKSQAEDFCDEKKNLKDTGIGSCECTDPSYFMNDEETECIIMYEEENKQNEENKQTNFVTSSGARGDNHNRK